MDTLAAVCVRHVAGPIDLLKIDVEGAELDVVEGADWAQFRPRVVVIEATVPDTEEPAWAQWEPRVLAAGYRFAYFDGLNRFYIEEGEPELLRHFERPVNVFDAYVPWSERHLQALTQEAQAARAKAENEQRRLAGALAEAHATIGRIHESASWRLTGPLRALGSIAARCASRSAPGERPADKEQSAGQRLGARSAGERPS